MGQLKNFQDRNVSPTSHDVLHNSLIFQLTLTINLNTTHFFDQLHKASCGNIKRTISFYRNSLLMCLSIRNQGMRKCIVSRYFQENYSSAPDLKQVEPRWVVLSTVTKQYIYLTVLTSVIHVKAESQSGKNVNFRLSRSSQAICFVEEHTKYLISTYNMIKEIS